MPNQLLRLDEVAAECRTVLSTVRWWCQTGKLRSLKVGRRRLVQRTDLDAFLDRCVDAPYGTIARAASRSG